MQKHLKKLPLLALAFSLALPAWAQDAETVVATVNGEDITLGQMIVARSALPEQYQQLPDTVLFTGILDQLIQQTALSQTLEGELSKRSQITLTNERRALGAAQVVTDMIDGVVTEEAVQAAYDEKYANADAGMEYNASHILVETEEEAKAIKEAIDGGADFAETAKEKSTGPSGPGGGSLGWFGPGMMVAPFEEAVVALEKGAVSDPVKTQFGWHIVKLNDSRAKEAPTLESVREELEAEVQAAAIEKKINEVTDAAKVDRTGSADIDPTILRELSLVDE